MNSYITYCVQIVKLTVMVQRFQESSLELNISEVKELCFGRFSFIKHIIAKAQKDFTSSGNVKSTGSNISSFFCSTPLSSSPSSHHQSQYGMVAQIAKQRKNYSKLTTKHPRSLEKHCPQSIPSIHDGQMNK